MKKIRSNKKVSNNKFSVKATKNIINTPKIASSKIATKPKKVDKPKIAIEKNVNYNEYKNRIIE